MIRRVLVVDDDTPVRELIRAILVRDGMTVEEARDGEEALRKIRAGEFQAIVLDLMMPKVSGYQVLEALTAERPSSRCVVIVSAAASSAIDKADPTIVRAKLRKPFEIEELSAAVRACVLESSQQ